MLNCSYKFSKRLECDVGLIDERLAAILVCADCHGELEEIPDESVLRCVKCGLRFGVSDGIPNMIVADATKSAGG